MSRSTALGRIYITDSGNDGLQVFQANGTYVGRFGSLGSGNGQFHDPAEIAITADGALVVADRGNARIQRISTSGSFLNSFGSAANDVSPRGSSIDSLGRTIVADSENHRIQIFDVDGLLVTQFGALGNGPGQFNAPQGVAIDGLNRILVADTGNHRIQVFDSSGTFSFAIGSQGSGNSQFQSPAAVAATSDGRFVVADTGNHRVQVFNLTGTFQAAFGSQGSLDSQFQSPQGIAFDGTSIFVADTGNTRIKRFNTGGTFQASFGTSGSGNGQFSSPTSVAIDTSGKLYVADRNNHRVQVFSTAGTFQYTFGSQGALDGQFREPLSVAVSDGARIVVTDQRNDRVQVFRATASRQFGVGSSIVAGNSAASGTSADLNSTGVFVSRGYNLIGVASGPSTGFTHSVNNDQVGTSLTPIDPRLGALTSLANAPPVHRLLLGSPAIDGGNPTTVLPLDQLGNPRIIDGNNNGVARADIGAVESLGTYLSGRVYLDNNSSGTLDNGESGAAGRTVYVDLNNNGRLDNNEPSAVTSNDLASTPGVDEAGLYTIEGVAAGSYRLRIATLSGFTTTSPVLVESNVTPSLTLQANEGVTQRPDNSQILARVEQPAIAGQETLFLASSEAGSVLLAAAADGSLRVVAAQGQTLTGGATLGDLLSAAARYTTDGTNRILLAPNASGFYGLYSIDSSGSLRLLVDGTTTVPGLTVPFDSSAGAFGPPSLSGDLVAFRGTASAGDTTTGFYLASLAGSLSALVDKNTPLPNNGGTPLFDNQMLEVALENETFAFLSHNSGATAYGIYLGNRPQQVQAVADLTTVIPNAVGTFTSFGASVQLSSGRAFFHGTGSSVQGIYSGTSTADLARVVDTTQLMPDGVGNFTSFDHSFSVAGGKLVFIGRGSSGQQGVYTNSSGALAKVFDLDDRLPNDSRVPDGFFLHPQSLSAGRLVFQVHFTDGTDAIVEARYPQTNVYDVSIVTGQQLAGLDFGTRPDNGSLQGELFADSDGDGLFDASESAYANLIVYLDQNNNRVRDTGEAFTTSDSLGRYQFNNRATLATYIVAVEPPAGFIFTTPGATNFNRYTVTLGAGETRGNLNFGLAPSGGGGGVASDSVVQGRLYIDGNSNGRYEVGETLLSNRQVFLDLNNNGAREGNEPLRTTNAQGFYNFTNLAAGAYSVRVVSQADMVQTSPLGNQLTTTTAPTGDGPETIAAGDFNRDGLADLVVANTETNNVSLLLNLGNGVFAAPQQLIVGSRPSGLAVADFNRDGWDDLAVTNYYSPLVSLFINTKNPAAPLSLSQSIALPETVTIGGYGSRGITVADFNQDSWPDLAVANEFSRKLALLTNNGSGATPQLSYSGAITLSGADGLVSGQFTDDNDDALYNSLDRADLAVLNFDSGQVTVLRNDGAGIFNTLGIYTVGVGAYGVTAADLNGDGRADLVTANFTANTVSVLMNQGGSFAAAVHYVAGAGPTSVVAVDLDNDGDRDLAVSNKSSRQVSILRNNGAGIFGTPDNLGVADLAGGVAFSVTAADLNHDQIADLVVASNQRSTISVLRNTLVTGSYRVQLTGVNTVSAMDFGLQPTTSAPLVTLSTTSNNLNETGGVTTVIATLSNSWGQPITVDLSYTGTAIRNVDYQASAAQILILPGQTSGSVTLTALGDNLSEAAESITVDITQVTGGAENGTQQVNVTIIDDDPLPLVTLDLIGRTVAENGGVATVTASLSAAAGQPVTVTFDLRWYGPYWEATTRRVPCSW